MMEENFKRIVMLSACRRAAGRIRRASPPGGRTGGFGAEQTKTPAAAGRAAIIIAAALTLTAAAAASFIDSRNDIVVSSVSELPAPTEDTPTAVAIVTDSQSAAQTLDEILAEGPYIYC